MKAAIAVPAPLQRREYVPEWACAELTVGAVAVVDATSPMLPISKPHNREAAIFLYRNLQFHGFRSCHPRQFLRQPVPIEFERIPVEAIWLGRANHPR